MLHGCSPAVRSAPRVCCTSPTTLASAQPPTGNISAARSFFALPSFAALDPALPQELAALPGVVGLVGVQLLRALPRSPLRSLDRFDAVYELLEHLRVVDVGDSECYREWDSVPRPLQDGASSPVCHDPSGSCRQLRPPLTWTEALSRLARSQSVRSDLPRRSKCTWCRRCHTPASCHSLRRCQQVLPEPQPISLGNISQEVPLFKTKTMSVSTTLPGARGLLPMA